MQRQGQRQHAGAHVLQAARGDLQHIRGIGAGGQRKPNLRVYRSRPKRQS